MPTHRRLSRLLMAAAAAAGVAACASGRQVYQATQDYGSPALGTDQADGDAALVSLSGAQVGSDRILQLSGNVILPVYQLDDGLTADARVSLLGARAEASLAAASPTLLGARVAVTTPGAPAAPLAPIVGTGPASLSVAAQGTAPPGAGVSATAAATTATLTPTDLQGALGASAPPTGLAAGTPATPVTGGVLGAASPINAALGSLPRPPPGR